MLIKNEIPLLEYDMENEALVVPTHENMDLKLPQRCVFAFLGDFVESYAAEHQCRKAAVFDSVVKQFPVYVTEHNGEQLCFCASPVGSSAAVQFLDWLIGYGVKEVVAVGCCGTLVGFPENVFLLPTRALRDEGTSYHYIAPSRYVDLNGLAVSALATTLQKRDVPYTECMTWTTDGFFRETKEKVAARKEEGCSVVEMECAGLAACAQFRKVLFSELLFTADTLANGYDSRGWGKQSYGTAFSIALDAVVAMC
ncbi:MAG: nucleoside phosphorylase [Treponema sp.]|nr:nucleoside phosphorylase [Treponema sp.]